MRALIVTDIQNDFLPGGALPVAGGDEVISVANRLIDRFDFIVATQDWHPADHLSFASQHPGKSVGDVVQVEGLSQILWPDHCVQNTRGADFAPGLNVEEFTHIIHKATDRRVDSYSVFFDNGRRRATGMHEVLQGAAVDRVYIVGLATDYCVKYTALDAVQAGFDTIIVLDGCRGIERKKGDIEKAVNEMKDAGVAMITSDKIF